MRKNIKLSDDSMVNWYRYFGNYEISATSLNAFQIGAFEAIDFNDQVMTNDNNIDGGAINGTYNKQIIGCKRRKYANKCLPKTYYSAKAVPIE
jgi:hypothetical protein